MTKARFDTSQPEVRVVQMPDANYIFLCLHESVEQEETEFGTNTYYEYDYNEIIDQNEDIDIDDVTNNPEKYLDYSVPSKSQEERIVELERKLLYYSENKCI